MQLDHALRLRAILLLEVLPLAAHLLLQSSIPLLNGMQLCGHISHLCFEQLRFLLHACSATSGDALGRAWPALHASANV